MCAPILFSIRNGNKIMSLLIGGRLWKAERRGSTTRGFPNPTQSRSNPIPIKPHAVLIQPDSPNHSKYKKNEIFHGYANPIESGAYLSHMAGTPSPWSPQILLDLTLDIMGFPLSLSSDSNTRL